MDNAATLISLAWEWQKLESWCTIFDKRPQPGYLNPGGDYGWATNL
jgi:hypothetical protein